MYQLLSIAQRKFSKYQSNCLLPRNYNLEQCFVSKIYGITNFLIRKFFLPKVSFFNNVPANIKSHHMHLNFILTFVPFHNAPFHNVPRKFLRKLRPNEHEMQCTRRKIVVYLERWLENFYLPPNPSLGLVINIDRENYRLSRIC